MVILSGKTSNQLTAVKTSLEDNLLINPASSRLSDINSAIINNKYRLKNLADINFSTISIIYTSTIIDGKIFCLSTNTNPGVVEVFDYQFNTLLTTINTGATQSSYGITFDSNYIYMSCIKGTPKSVYIRRYNRRTLAYVDEYLLYQNDTPYLFSMAYKDGYIYVPCGASAGTNQHRVRKWNTTTFTVDVSVYFNTPLSTSLSDYGLCVGGSYDLSTGTNLYKPVILNYSDLTAFKVFPKTNLTAANTRQSFVYSDKLYIANDAGIVSKYDINTTNLENEVLTSSLGGAIRSMFYIYNVGILIADSFGYIYLFDFNLNLIKTFSILPVATANTHSMLVDKNNTIWFHSYQYAKVYKKQFIDQTEDVI